MATFGDARYFLAQAQTCRNMASTAADEQTAAALRELAQEYELKARRVAGPMPRAEFEAMKAPFKARSDSGSDVTG